MKQYEAYKTTNIPWLDKIPKHWKLIRNAIIFKEKKYIVGSNYKNYTLLSLTINGIIKRDIEGGKGKFPASFNTYKKVETNNIIFCLFDIDETPRTVGLSQHNGMITGAYNIFDIKQNNIYYIYYYYLSLDFFKQLKPLYSGLRKTIKINKFFSLETPIPPKEEQNKIVAYLDYQVSNINKLILSKRKQITLLEEYKKTKISEVVTKGLNPNVEMKDSGIDWIGQIPKHWESIKFKYLFYELSIKGNPKLPLLVASQQIGVIPKNIYGKRTVEAQKDLDKFKLVMPDNFVISLRSFQGGIEYSTYKGIISPAYTILNQKLENSSLFFKYLFKSFSFVQLLKLCVTGIREGQNINYSILKNKYIPIPPLNEQKEIAAYLDNLTFKLDNLISKHKLYIEKLEEYKKTLISDVVTGKIDVRDIVIPEYEKVDIVENNNEDTDNLAME